MTAKLAPVQRMGVCIDACVVFSFLSCTVCFVGVSTEANPTGFVGK